MVHENCIILHFYTSSHIKEKCAQFLFFETFSFLVTKRPGFHTLIVKQNKEFV